MKRLRAANNIAAADQSHVGQTLHSSSFRFKLMINKRGGKIKAAFSHLEDRKRWPWLKSLMSERKGPERGKKGTTGVGILLAMLIRPFSANDYYWNCFLLLGILSNLWIICNLWTVAKPCCCSDLEQPQRTYIDSLCQTQTPLQKILVALPTSCHFVLWLAVHA